MYKEKLTKNGNLELKALALLSKNVTKIVEIWSSNVSWLGKKKSKLPSPTLTRDSIKI